MTEPTEEDKTDDESETQPLIKPKKVRSPEQLEVLKRAREKALEIRRENAKLHKAEKEIERREKETKLNDRKEKVAKYEQETVATAPRIKKKKKVVYVEESESSESEEEEVVSKKKRKEPKKVEPKKTNDNYAKLYNQMFSFV